MYPLYGSDGSPVPIFHRTLIGHYAEVMHALLKIKVDLNTVNDKASAKASTNSYRRK